MVYVDIRLCFGRYNSLLVYKNTFNGAAEKPLRWREAQTKPHGASTSIFNEATWRLVSSIDFHRVRSYKRVGLLFPNCLNLGSSPCSGDVVVGTGNGKARDYLPWLLTDAVWNWSIAWTLTDYSSWGSIAVSFQDRPERSRLAEDTGRKQRAPPSWKGENLTIGQSRKTDELLGSWKGSEWLRCPGCDTGIGCVNWNYDISLVWEVSIFPTLLNMGETNHVSAWMM